MGYFLKEEYYKMSVEKNTVGIAHCRNCNASSKDGAIYDIISHDHLQVGTFCKPCLLLLLAAIIERE